MGILQRLYFCGMMLDVEPIYLNNDKVAKMTYEEDTIRCNGIFRAGQVKPHGRHLMQDKAIISDRMLELYHLLSSYNYDPKEHSTKENIHWVAILGAVGRLFESLMTNRAFSQILSSQFKISAKRVIYHSRGPFCITKLGITDPVPPGGPEYVVMFPSECVISFFTHCYEHSRTELDTIGIQTPSLAHKVNLSDRTELWFHAVINMGSIWAEQRVRDSEIKSKAIARLSGNEEKFLRTCEHLKKNRTYFIEEADHESQKTSDIIIGSYLGTEIAWLSCDVSSLLYGKAFDDQTTTIPSRLSKQEKCMIETRYTKYLDPGKQYRHKNLSLTELLRRPELNSDTPAPQIEPAMLFLALLLRQNQKKSRETPVRVELHDRLSPAYINTVNDGDDFSTLQTPYKLK